MNKNHQYWYQEHLLLAKDCERCADFDVCGGLRVDAPISSCLDLCDRNHSKASNGSVCKCSPSYFVQRKREVRGWGLDVPRAEEVAPPILPQFVPLIYDRSRRSHPFDCDAAVVPLKSVVSRRTGNLLVRTRAELTEKFLISTSAKLILGSVHHDPTLEAYWSMARARDVAYQLRSLELDLVTTPNFSVFANVQRWDNFHNMKRIAIAWYELAAAGNPTALHINGRTTRDYERWAAFLIEHSEVSTIAFEFQTGTASVHRGAQHVHWLQMLAQKVGRPLTLVSFGGYSHLGKLKGAFGRVVHVSATPYLKAAHFRKLAQSFGRLGGLRWSRTNDSVEESLTSNVRHYSELVESIQTSAA